MNALPTRVHLALLNEPQQFWEGQENLQRHAKIIQGLDKNFVLTDHPEEAALIIFLESNNYKNWRQIPALLNDKLVCAYPEKCYTLNYRANPVDFFPGVYTSLARSRHRPDWSRPGAYYIGNPNPWAGEYEDRPWQPKYLFSFRGAMSHPVRRQMLTHAAHWHGNPITWVDRWFDHTEPEQREYLQEIVDSQFVLCPRGIAVSSHRLYEVMRLGRVPVILSDDWLPPRGPDWPGISVTIPENAVDLIPKQLQALAAAAPGMGQKAKEAWDRWFSPTAMLHNQLIEISDLAERRQHLTQPDFAQLWHSRQFYRRHQWLPSQRMVNRLKRLAGRIAPIPKKTSRPPAPSEDEQSQRALRESSHPYEQPTLTAQPTPIHLALLNEAQQSWEGQGNLERQAEILQRFPKDFILTENPEEAALIVFLESNNFKNWRQIPTLLSHPLVHAYPEKCYTLNYHDTPVGFFPGVYTSLPRYLHQPGWSRPGAYYLGNPNPWAGEYEDRPWQPKCLFSFRGAMSHSVRRHIVAHAAAWSGNPIRLMDRWFNHTEAEQREYLQEIVDSQFVLCPRGIAVSSHRLFEVMRLGRVPVILADDWLPPRGPDWPSFSVTIPEHDLDRIPEQLQALSHAAPDMGRRAREAWDRWFSPAVMLHNQLIEIRDLASERRDLPPPDFAKLWNSRTFYRQHRWLLSQRIMGRLKRLVGR